MQCTGYGSRVFAALKRGVEKEDAKYTVHLSASANQVETNSRLQITNAASKKMNAFLDNKKLWIRAYPRAAPKTWETEEALYTLPVLVKGDTGNNGEQVWKCETREQVENTLEYARNKWKKKWHYHLQQYIGNGTVVRAYVVLFKNGSACIWDTGLLKEAAGSADVPISIREAPWKDDVVSKCAGIARSLPWDTVHRNVLGVWAGIDVVAENFETERTAYVIDINPAANLSVRGGGKRRDVILSMVESLPTLQEGWLYSVQDGLQTKWGVHAETDILKYMQSHGTDTWSFPDPSVMGGKLWLSVPVTGSQVHTLTALYASTLPHAGLSVHVCGRSLQGVKTEMLVEVKKLMEASTLGWDAGFGSNHAMVGVYYRSRLVGCLALKAREAIRFHTGLRVYDEPDPDYIVQETFGGLTDRVMKAVEISNVVVDADVSIRELSAHRRQYGLRGVFGVMADFTRVYLQTYFPEHTPFLVVDAHRPDLNRIEGIYEANFNMRRQYVVQLGPTWTVGTATPDLMVMF